MFCPAGCEKSKRNDFILFAVRLRTGTLYIRFEDLAATYSPTP
jgi:hypothetical protein